MNDGNCVKCHRIGGYASGQSKLTVNQFLRVREFVSHSTNSPSVALETHSLSKYAS